MIHQGYCGAQCGATPTPTPTATPSATPTPTPTATPSATPTTTPTATPTATPTPTPTATPTNLVKNGNFSSALVTNNTLGWKNIQTGTVDVTGGTLNLHPSMADIAEVEQVINVTSGHTYSLTGSLWSTGTPTYGYLYVYNVGSGTLIASANTNTSSTANLSITPTGSQIRIVLHAYKQQTGVFHFDNIVLQ